MRLPGAERAIVEPTKVRDYLLSLAHPIGSPKALFFLRLGFRQSDWYLLRDELLRLARDGEGQLLSTTPHGRKFLVRGRIEGPWRKRAGLTTIWILDSREKVPRLVTAYPS